MAVAQLRRARISPAALSALLLAALLASSPAPVAASDELARLSDSSAAEFIATITPASLRARITDFANLGSRIPGYPGHDRAADLIERSFRRFGLARVQRESFQVASPVDFGARLESDRLEEPITIYPFWPNLIRLVSTLPEGITGELIYVGRGELSDLNGFQLEPAQAAPGGQPASGGPIVMMEFNTAQNYLALRSLGAAAILFVEPRQALRAHAAPKVLEVPLNVPRFWLRRSDAQRLKPLAGHRLNPQDPNDLRVSRGITVTLHSRMRWLNVLGHNISGWLDGIVPPIPSDDRQDYADWQDLGRELIVLTAYYDSMSVVPSLAPGAEQACGIVALLKLAELMAAQRQRIDALCASAEPLRHLLATAVAVGASLRRSVRLKHWADASRQLAKISAAVTQSLKICQSVASDRRSDVQSTAARLAKLLAACQAELAQAGQLLQRLGQGDGSVDQSDLVARLDQALTGLGRELQVRPVLFLAADANGLSHTGMAHWLVKHLEQRLFDNQIYLPSEFRLDLPKAIDLVDAAVEGLQQLSRRPTGSTSDFRTAVALEHLGRWKAPAVSRLLGRLYERLAARMDRQPDVSAALAELQAVRQKLQALADAGLPIDAHGNCPGWWLFDPELFRRGQSYPFKLLLSLELSSHSKTVTAIYTGDRTAALQIKRRRLLGDYAALLGEYARRFRSLVGGPSAQLEEPYYLNGVTPIKGRSFQSFLPISLSLASALPVIINRPGMSLATAYDVRARFDTPSDRPEFVDFQKLAHQVRMVALLVRELLGDPSFVLRGYKSSVLREYVHGFLAQTKEKRIGESVIADHEVPGALVVLSRNGTWAGVRRHRIGMTNQQGEYWHPFIWLTRVNQDAYMLDAHGNIIKAADRGNEGEGTYPLSARTRSGIIVLFKCRSLDIYDNLDPMLIKYLDKVSLYDKFDAPPEHWGYNTVPSETEVPPGHVVFFEPNRRIKVCLRRGYWGFQYLLLNCQEGDRENPLGFGLDVGPNRRASAFRCAERVTDDMIRLNRQRFATLNKYGIYSELIADLLKRGQQERQQARRYYQQRRYDAYADAVRRARGFVTAAYPLIKDLEKDTVKGIVLYFALLIPFAFFCERLLFGFVDIKKQILANAGIFVTVFAIMRIVHPAFMVSKSPYVIFLAFIILALAVIVLWLIVGKFNEQMAQLKRASSRIHHTDVGRLSATYAAVMLGISNMRKRRLRTFLTTVTLVLITYAVLSFTSLSSYTHFFELPVEASPSYQGALVRDRMWQPLSRQWIQYVHAAFAPDNAVLAPRSWVFIEQENTLSQPVRHHRIIRLHPSAILSVRQAQAAAASSNLEALLLTAGGATVAWPRDDQTDACVMTQALAERLGLQQEDVGMATVRIAGQDLLLVGILASPSFDGVTLQPSSHQARPSASTRLALFVSPALLERLGPTRQVRLVPDQRARQSGFAAPAAAELLSTASPPAVVKLGLANVAGFVGMTSLEPQVSHIDRLLVAGRWLSSRYAPECVLPDSVARQLNITADQVEAGQVTVRTLGTDWKVVGLLDTDRLRTFFDLDGGQISPLEPRIAKPGEATGAARIREQEARAQVSTELREFKHIDPSRVVFATFERLNDLGGQIRCIAVGFRDMDQGRREVRSFLERSNALVFWADAGRTEALTSMGRTGVSGLGDLLVPILIGAFIIVNTMMGSVYERHREIGVYSSVGLAPVHVSALFIAESFVYAVMGAIVGYLVGQVSAKVMMSYQVAGVELNYSSASTMLATLLVMGVVLLSAIYPSRIASQMAVPDVTRRWVLTEPQGDHWYFRFPFTVATQQVLALFVFLNDWFDGYREESVGVFYTTELDFHAERAQHGQTYVISLTMWLAPFDRGVSQRVRFRTMPTEDEGVSQIEVEIDRLAGEHAAWYRLNRRFLRELRKQFLIFRTVPPAVKQQYVQEGSRALGLAVAPA